MKTIIESTFECNRDGLTIRGTEYRPEVSGQVQKILLKHSYHKDS